MAKQKAAKKKNGKAKTKREPGIDTYLIPLDFDTLTPERAREWLRKDQPHWMEFLEVACRAASQPGGAKVATYANGGAIASEFAYSVQRLAEACLAVVESGEPMPVKSSLLSLRRRHGLAEWSDIEHAVGLLGLVLAVEDEDFDILETAGWGLRRIVKALRKAADVGSDAESARMLAAFHALVHGADGAAGEVA